ncbi:MAG TPA: hypothetical protein VN661_05150, partial [Candidatus Acidoferrales bacterium]|nr:hypothetical protein [Candidatus Acidoferrales bacterium]
MSTLKMTWIMIGLCFALTGAARAQNAVSSTPDDQHVPSRAEDHLWYHDQCPSLQKTELPDLAKYLQTATPDAGNSVCVT